MDKILSPYGRCKRWLLRIVPFLVTFGLLTFLLHHIGLSRFASIPKQISLRFLLPAGALTIPFFLLKSYKWYYIAKTGVPNLKFPMAVSSFLVGLGMGLITPSRIGELARAGCLKSNKTEALFLVMTDKLMDVTALATLFLISMLFFNRPIGILLILCGFICSAILYLVIASNVFFTLRKLQFLPKRLQQALTHLKEVKRKVLIKNFSLAVACFLILMLQFYFILLSFSRISFIAVIIGLPIILVASSFPISIAGLGLREMATMIILSDFGITKEKAAIAAFLLFIVNAFIPGLVGLLLAPYLYKATQAHHKL